MKKPWKGHGAQTWPTHLTSCAWNIGSTFHFNAGHSSQKVRQKEFPLKAGCFCWGFYVNLQGSVHSAKGSIGHGTQGTPPPKRNCKTGTHPSQTPLLGVPNFSGPYPAKNRIDLLPNRKIGSSHQLLSWYLSLLGCVWAWCPQCCMILFHAGTALAGERDFSLGHGSNSKSYPQ